MAVRLLHQSSGRIMFVIKIVLVGELHLWAHICVAVLSVVDRFLQLVSVCGLAHLNGHLLVGLALESDFLARGLLSLGVGP